METLFTVLLVRFAIIAGALVVLGLVLFAVVLVLHRRGQEHRVRQGAAGLARLAADRLDRRGQGGGSVARDVARRLTRVTGGHR